MKTPDTDLLEGRATPESTRKYFERITRRDDPENALSLYRVPGHLPLHLSRIGVGTFRMSEGVAAHHQSIESALLNGCNVLDISGSYGGGNAPPLIRRILRELTGLGLIHRDEIFLLGGLGPGKTLEVSRISDAIEDLRLSLGVEFLDGFVLRHPVPDLSFQQRKELILRASESLEKEVEKGRIGAYGFSGPCSSHRVSRSLHHALLEEDLPSFRIAGFPANLVELDPATETGDLMLDFARKAREAGLWIFGYRPLNALYLEHPFRLARSLPVSEEGQLDESLEIFFRGLKNLESRIQSGGFAFDSHSPSLSETLPRLMEIPASVEAFHEASFSFIQLYQKIVNRIRIGDDPLAFHHASRYSAAVNRALVLWDRKVRMNRSHVADRLHRAMLKHTNPDSSGERSLAELATGSILSREIPHTILVGMRHPDQVQEMLKSDYEHLPDERTVRIFSSLASRAARLDADSRDRI